MKNSFRYLMIAAILCVGVSATANAAMSYGVNAGANWSTFSGTPSDQTEAKVGFQFGGVLAQPMSDTLTMEYGLQYVQKGSKVKGVDATTSVDYIQVPVLAKFAVMKNATLSVGGSLGFVVNAKSKFNGVETDAKDRIQSTELSLLFGGSYQFTKNIEAGIQYNWGLTNLSETDSKGLQNRGLTVSGTYLF